MGWDGMDGWMDGMVIIGHRSSKSIFDANNILEILGLSRAIFLVNGSSAQLFFQLFGLAFG